MNDVPLFDVPTTPPPQPAPKSEWTPINTRRPCDWCTRTLAQTGGTGPRPEPARWRHTGPDGDTLLCYRHGRETRAGDPE